jgi:hypothetical protein
VTVSDVSEKPTVSDLGLDPAELEWVGSGEGPGTIQIAFAHACGLDWVLLRVCSSPDGLISVFTPFEWRCFVDGAKDGEFDDLADWLPESGILPH